METFEISDNIIRDLAGVYLISFSSGHYYFGSSMNVRKRAKTHISTLRPDSVTNPCKSLLKMKTAPGHAVFSLLEPFSGEKRLDLYYKEWALIEDHIGDNMMLNDTRVTGSGVGVGLYIKKRLYDKLKVISDQRGRGISDVIEKALTEHFDYLFNR